MEKHRIAQTSNGREPKGHEANRTSMEWKRDVSACVVMICNGIVPTGNEQKRKGKIC